MISWVLFVTLLPVRIAGLSLEDRKPVALPATSESHCRKLQDMVKSLKDYDNSFCLQLSTHVEVLGE